VGDVRHAPRNVENAVVRVPYRRHQPERGHGAERRERCARTVVVEKATNLFLQRRHPSMRGARYVGRNEDNPVVRVQSDGHR